MTSASGRAFDNDLDDWRPSTLFDRRSSPRAERVGGVVAATAAVVLMPAVIGLAAIAADAIRGAVPERPPETLEVIETRFVKLGRSNKTLLPSNEAPSPDPVDESVVAPPPPEPTPAAEPAPVEAPPKPVPSEKPDTKKAPEESADDLLDKLTQNADAIATTSKAPQREGHEEGIDEGTETEANENLYIGKLYAYFRRGWEVPTHISEADLQALVCRVTVNITEDARVGDFKITKPSGNDAFDRSVEHRLSQAEGATLPEPPQNIAARFLGNSITLRFTPPKR